MDRNFLIQLTNNLYRLTLFFPKKEPLRYKIREIADEILIKTRRGLTSANLAEEFEILDSFFEVAKAQNWVKSEEILAIQKEYRKIKEELSFSPEATGVRPLQVFEKPAKTLTSQVSRQEKILEFLRENGQAQIWQLKQIFPEVSKRTLRRDFENLLKQNKIERIGERNNTFYKLYG